MLKIVCARFGSFSDPFSRFSNHLSYRFENLWGTVSLCGGAAPIIGDRKGTTKKGVTKILPNVRVNFLVRFASKPLFYWITAGNPLEMFRQFFGAVRANFWLSGSFLAPEIKVTLGKAAKCRQKVCSSKRPPKLEPRSVRPNEVFENLTSRICPEKQRIGSGGSVREKSVRANDPIRMTKIKGAFSLNNLFVGTVRPPEHCQVFCVAVVLVLQGGVSENDGVRGGLGLLPRGLHMTWMAWNLTSCDPPHNSHLPHDFQTSLPDILGGTRKD